MSIKESKRRRKVDRTQKIFIYLSSQKQGEFFRDCPGTVTDDDIDM